MQLKIRIVDAKFLQFTYEGHILVLVPTGGDLLYYCHSLFEMSAHETALLWATLLATSTSRGTLVLTCIIIVADTEHHRPVKHYTRASD